MNFSASKYGLIDGYRFEEIRKDINWAAFENFNNIQYEWGKYFESSIIA